MENFFVVSTTHWDREWYRTFNDFRIRLADMINSLLYILDTDPSFKCFTFDGQTSMLEDYLAIFPENEEKIRKYIKEGRISIGPWYVIPDEFIPSGEATIRNLLIGDEIAERFGKKLMCGYLPDNFGHISQMPQILRNFRIDNALFFRGIDKKTSKKNLFLWESPDETQILAEYLVAGYWNLKSWGHLGKDAVEQFKDAWDTLKKHSILPFYLLLNGSDHLYPQPDLTTHIEEIKAAIPNITIANTSIQDYMDIIKKEIKENQLNRIVGELREDRDASINPSITSTRYDIKLMNHQCESQLEKYTEPIHTFLYTLGQQYPQNFIEYAWKQIIQNHPHDSICACSIDEVMDDVEVRYRHSHQISSRLLEIGLSNLTNQIVIDSIQNDEKILVVYNPLNWTRTDILEATIGFPLDQEVKDIKIFDNKGKEIPYELVDVFEKVQLKEFLYQSKEKHPTKYFSIKFLAEDIPSMGYTSYKVKPFLLRDKRKYQQQQMLTSFDRKIENEYYIVTPMADGSISVLDKKNQILYENIHVFEDRGDSGDTYNYAPPFRDEICYPTLKAVSVIRNTPLASTLKITLELLLPDKLDEKYFKRSPLNVSCLITTYITLYTKIDRIDFKTVIDNNGTDHLLSVKFPTTIKSDYDYAHSPFDIVRRKIKLSEVMKEDNEALTPFKPMGIFVDLHDTEKGLTLINKGLYEYCTKFSNKGTDLIITLLRSVGWMFREPLAISRDGQPCTTPVFPTYDSQCLGTQVFEYSLVLHKGTVVESKAYQKSYEFNYPLKSFVGDRNNSGNLPSEYSLLEVNDDSIIISALKKCRNDESVVVRFYNISDKEIRFDLNSSLNLVRAYKANMLEENVEKLTIIDNKINLLARKKEILTIKLYTT